MQKSFHSVFATTQTTYPPPTHPLQEDSHARANTRTHAHCIPRAPPLHHLATRFYLPRETCSAADRSLPLAHQARTLSSRKSFPGLLQASDTVIAADAATTRLSLILLVGRLLIAFLFLYVGLSELHRLLFQPFTPYLPGDGHDVVWPKVRGGWGSGSTGGVGLGEGGRGMKRL